MAEPPIVAILPLRREPMTEVQGLHLCPYDSCLAMLNLRDSSVVYIAFQTCYVR